MKREKYRTKRSKSGLQYEFVSVGPKGRIQKLVKYTRFESQDDLYYLVFGDLDRTGKLNQFVKSNNSDSTKVLATVAGTVRDFLMSYPNAGVVFEGSTDARTRLYQMAIMKNRQLLTKDLTILGFFRGEWSEIDKDRRYESFLVELKSDYL